MTRRALRFLPIGGTRVGVIAGRSNGRDGRSTISTLCRFSQGKPNFNFPGAGENMREFVGAAFAEQYDRIARVKQKYDPSNLFRVNQNIT
jgi:hypothetical protein